MVTEREINRRFEALTEQRNNALNQVVLLHGEVSELRFALEDMKAALDAALATMGAMADAAREDKNETD